jgi:hypothetical protein
MSTMTPARCVQSTHPAAPDARSQATHQPAAQAHEPNESAPDHATCGQPNPASQQTPVRHHSYRNSTTTLNLVLTISTTLRVTIQPCHGPQDHAPQKVIGVTDTPTKNSARPYSHRHTAHPAYDAANPCSEANNSTSTTPTGTAPNSSDFHIAPVTSEQQPRKLEPSSSTANEPSPTRTAGRPAFCDLGTCAPAGDHIHSRSKLLTLVPDFFDGLA